jgi:hypothetical protein
MNQIPIRFVIRELSEDEMENLRDNHMVITKMILAPDDFALFRYKQGDLIEVENQDGYRRWCSITDLEIVQGEDRVIIIFSLLKEGVCVGTKTMG